MSLRRCVVAALMLCLAPIIWAEDASGVFSRFKSASGGARWDSVHSLRSTGTLSAGGLSGTFRVTHDLSSGRFVQEYTLGPLDGGDGYDGRIGWTRSPGGEVSAQDAPEALRRARTQAWLDARGFWYPDRSAATYAAPITREDRGKRYHVVVVTPADGDPITLWFAADSHLLARTVQVRGDYTSTTRYDDYRDIGGLRVPFHVITDMTDGAGRTDPRLRTEVRFEHISPGDAIADNNFAIPAMTATARIDDRTGVTRIPFDLINNHIYVDGHVDGKAVRFLVDTGGVNLLTPAAAARLHLKTEGNLAATGVGDERADLAFARAAEVRVGAAVLAKPLFYVIDLGQLDAIAGVKADGLVGYEMFRRFGVEIDYAKRVLTLTEPARLVPPAGATAIAFELDDRIPIVAATLDGIPLRVSIDTGSRASLTLHSPFVREHDLVARYQAGPESVIGWGVGGPSRGRPVRLGVLQLAGLQITGAVGGLFTGAAGAFSNPDRSGNLGGGILRRFTVTFDYSAKRMYLAPNAEFEQPESFDRSGLWLMVDREALEIADVAPESAAERAGLAVGDRILTIAGAAVSTRSIAQWRQHLREEPAGTKVPIRFNRGGQTREATLTLADRVPATRKRRESIR